MSTPEYPSVLTVKSWEKAKGVLARLSGVETGITALLKAAEQAYKTAPFSATTDYSKLNLAAKGSVDDLKNFQREYLSEFQPKFKKLENHFRSLSDELEQKSKSFKNDPKLEKFSKVIDLMASAANKFSYSVAWGTVSDDFQKKIAEYLKKFEENRGREVELLNDAIDACKKCIKQLQTYKDPPTTKEYVKLFAQYLRLPGTHISTAGKANPEVAKLFAPYMEYAKNNFLVEPKANTNMSERVQNDLAIFQDTLNLLKRRVSA